LIPLLTLLLLMLLLLMLVVRAYVYHNGHAPRQFS
jgi:hypothetical protein